MPSLSCLPSGDSGRTDRNTTSSSPSGSNHYSIVLVWPRPHGRISSRIGREANKMLAVALAYFENTFGRCRRRDALFVLVLWPISHRRCRDATTVLTTCEVRRLIAIYDCGTAAICTRIDGPPLDAQMLIHFAISSSRIVGHAVAATLWLSGRQ